jgi:hypothetical protein
MAETVTTEAKQEKAVLIGAAFSPAEANRLEEYLDELEFLASTLGLETVKRYVQKLPRPEPSTYIGKGKAEEIRNLYVHLALRLSYLMMTSLHHNSEIWNAFSTAKYTIEVSLSWISFCKERKLLRQKHR